MQQATNDLLKLRYFVEAQARQSIFLRTPFARTWVTHGQWDIRATVTFPAPEPHQP